MDNDSVSLGNGELLLVRVRVPDLNIEKCLQFQKEELIWEVKQQTLAALPKDLEESFNYGLFHPPSNGKAGKFLDEERRLSEYPFQGPIGYLEMKFKRRVYKMLTLDEKQLKNINSKSNLRKFLDHVLANNVEKITKMLTKGLDPNFHCQDSGETPLSLISGIRNRPARMVMSLVNGGAIMDFRTRDGSTALHRAVAGNNIEAVRTMLDLGASPNYRDGKNLTPLYHSVINQTDASVCETLLHDHGSVGAQDLQGWQEVHQTCRNGMVQHLEHLLFYGADMNVRNASGNTPLHVCAVNNQDSCARMLLFRGCDKECLNYAGQTAYQVAVIAGNLELSDVIQYHKLENIVPFKEVPKFNPRRRQSCTPLSRSMSDAGSLQYDTLRRIESPLTNNFLLSGKLPSPSLSDRSLPPFSSSSSVSETSTGSGGSNSTTQEDEHLDSASALAASICNDHQSDILSVSSGLGTSSNSGSGGSTATPTHRDLLLKPGLMVVCLDNYHSVDPGHLHIFQGDIIEVTGSTDVGLLEGELNGKTGLFPVHCIQEVRLRHPHSMKNLSLAPRIPGRREIRELEYKHCFTSPKNMTLLTGEPRTVVLHKGTKGFGFVLRGAKAASPLMEMIPSDRCPGLQYMDDVDPGGVADMAGIIKGDFLLAINNEEITQASHETVVNLIRKSGDLVSLTVVTVTLNFSNKQGSSSTLPNPRQIFTLPRKLLGSGGRSPLQHPPPPPKRDPNTTLSVGRARAKSMVASMAAIEALDAAILKHDSSSSPSTSSLTEINKPDERVSSCSIKPKGVAHELELIFQKDAGLTAGNPHKENLEDIHKNVTMGNDDSAHSSPSAKNKVYTSVSEMKRSKRCRPGGGELANLHKEYHSTPDLEVKTATDDDLPDLEEIKPEKRRSQSNEYMGPGYFTLPGKKSQLSELLQESSFRTLTKIRPVQSRTNSLPRKSCSQMDYSKIELLMRGPAPTHPPPPPPISQIVAVDTSSFSVSDYARVETQTNSKKRGPVSSFKPDSVPIYSTTQATGETIPGKSPKKRSPTRTHSLPPRPSRPMVLKRIEGYAETPASSETYSVNGINYTTYTTFRSPITPDECDSVSNRLFIETVASAIPETPTTPTNLRHFQVRSKSSTSRENTPHIPDPDYDLSDNDMSLSGSDSSTLRRNNNLWLERERKKKKTVSFIMDEELANIVHSTGTMTKKDSILKDRSKEKEREIQVTAQRATTENLIRGRPAQHTSPAKLVPALLNTPKTPVEPTFHSFSKGQMAKTAVKRKPGMAHPDWEGNSILGIMEPKDAAVKIIIVKVHSKHEIPTSEIDQKLKTSSSIPESNDDGDNSSSGVSSDQDQEPITSSQTDMEASKVHGFITTVPVQFDKVNNKSFECESQSSGTGSTTSDMDLSDKTWIVLSEKDGTGQNVLSMKKENQVKYSKKTRDNNNSGISSDNKADKEPAALMTATMEKAEIEWTPGNEQSHYQNFSIMMEQGQSSSLLSQSIYETSLADHVNVRRPFQKSVPAKITQSLTLERLDSQSIEQSLALIHKHVKGLNDVNLYGGVPPPPPSEVTEIPDVCPLPDRHLLLMPPPPGFSDSESGSHSDTSEPGTFSRFGFTRVSKPRSLAVPSLTEQLKKDRVAAKVARDATKKSQGRSSDGIVFKTGSGQKPFRTQNII